VITSFLCQWQDFDDEQNSWEEDYTLQHHVKAPSWKTYKEET
jgi:hypothetical protein